MEKISSSIRYAEDYGSLHVEADVQKTEKENSQPSINGGSVRNADNSVNAWFNIQPDGQLNIGGLKAEDAETVKAVTGAIVDFYKEVIAL